MLQNTTGEEEFWLYKNSVTIKVRENGSNITAEGPMYHANDRADQVMALLTNISTLLPGDMNITITGHDVPFIVIGGAHKKQHVEAAEKGEYIDDFDTYQEDWSSASFSLPFLPLRSESDSSSSSTCRGRLVAHVPSRIAAS
jgi:hypothetical protein